ncbi:hypothetical protein HMI54_014946 [Coelomomyces lativittatus]|nr:hypothetical protein HMI55_001731 [Coelomomyces lativittatus]KAJ1507328.1 hypothetical protein HMI56_000154 [Coelomomyces lativittatus]KAJ1518569.1 hypothetical protein HMI54_014946 [Coelomomyces lativittatus]
MSSSSSSSSSWLTTSWKSTSFSTSQQTSLQKIHEVYLQSLLHLISLPYFDQHPNLVLQSILTLDLDTSSSPYHDRVLLLSEPLYFETFTSLQLTMLMIIILLKKKHWFRFICTSLHPFFTTTLYPLHSCFTHHGWHLLHFTCLQATWTQDLEWVKLEIEYLQRKHLSTTKNTIKGVNACLNFHFLSFLLLLDHQDLISFFNSLQPLPTWSLEHPTSNSFMNSFHPSPLLPSSTSSSSSRNIPFWFDLMNSLQSVSMLSFLFQLHSTWFLKQCQEYPTSYFIFLTKPNALEFCQWYQTHITSTFPSTFDPFYFLKKWMEHQPSFCITKSTIDAFKFILDHHAFTSTPSSTTSTSKTTERLPIPPSLAEELLKRDISTWILSGQNWSGYFESLHQQLQHEIHVRSSTPIHFFSNENVVLEETESFHAIESIQNFGFSRSFKSVKERTPPLDSRTKASPLSLPQPLSPPLLPPTPLSTHPTPLDPITPLTLFVCTYPSCTYQISSPTELHHHFLSHFPPSTCSSLPCATQTTTPTLASSFPMTNCLFPHCPFPTTPHSIDMVHFFLTCQSCFMITPSFKFLHQHTLLHHGGPSAWLHLQPLWQLKLPYVCHECMEPFRSSFEVLKHHRQMHGDKK